MGQNKRKQAQLKRMFHRQGGRCAWCGMAMKPPGSHKGRGKPDPMLCTFDHFDDRFSDERGKHGGEFRNVAACWTCNNRRAQMQQANISKQVLWEKSGAYPIGHEAHARPNARNGFRRVGRTDPAIGPRVDSLLRVGQHGAREGAADDAMEA